MNRIKILLCFLLLAAFVLALSAQEKAVGSSPTASKRFAEWAWDMSYDTLEEYPITAYSYWRPPQTPLIVNLFATYDRTRSNIDDWAFTELAIFHPVVLNLSESMTLALGGYVRGVQIYREGWENIASPLPMLSATDTDIQSIAVGFSSLWSFPVPGIQIMFMVGYMEGRAKTETNVLFPEVVIPNPGPMPGPPIVIPSMPAGIDTLQKEAGLDTSLRMTWHSEKRNYLSGMDLQIVHYFQTTATAKRSVSHPVLAIPTEKGIDTGDTTFVNVNFWGKVLAFDLHTLPHFLHPDYKRRHVFSLEVGGTLSHTAALHGHSWAAGCRINYADIISVAYLHAWEQKNNASDYDTLFLEFLVAL